MIDRATKPGYFFYHTTAQKAVLSRGGQEDSFDVVGERFVDMSHLQLQFKIGNGSQSSQQDLGLPDLGVGDGEAIETIHF